LNPVSVIEHQPDWVEALGISRDGKWLAAGRYNGTLSVYDMKTYKQVEGPLTAFAPVGPSNKGVVRQSAEQWTPLRETHSSILTNEAKRSLKTKGITLLQIAKAKRYLKTKELFL
jgi:hypothetical protein